MTFTFNAIKVYVCILLSVDGNYLYQFYGKLACCFELHGTQFSNVIDFFQLFKKCINMYKEFKFITTFLL